MADENTFNDAGSRKRDPDASGVPAGLSFVCESDKGSWFKVTGTEAANAATVLSSTGVRMWIEAQAKWDLRDGKAWPDFYLLLDDKESPTRAHVALAAIGKDVAEAGKTPISISERGHATGFANRNPYPAFAADIEALVAHERLEFSPNYMGGPIYPHVSLSFGRPVDGTGPGWELCLPEEATAHLIGMVSASGREMHAGAVEIGGERQLGDVLAQLVQSYPETCTDVSVRITPEDVISRRIQGDILGNDIEGSEGDRREALIALQAQLEILRAATAPAPEEDAPSPM